MCVSHVPAPVVWIIYLKSQKKTKNNNTLIFMFASLCAVIKSTDVCKGTSNPHLTRLSGARHLQIKEVPQQALRRYRFAHTRSSADCVLTGHTHNNQLSLAQFSRRHDGASAHTTAAILAHTYVGILLVSVLSRHVRTTIVYACVCS